MLRRAIGTGAVLVAGFGERAARVANGPDAEGLATLGVLPTGGCG